MPSKHNFPPRRGQIKIKIIKGLLKSAAKILSTGAELKDAEGSKRRWP
ncbi:hypothetical protein COLO4_18388 [Corchorus olitorius]|uniref:Uncharacterized protein n=1 Tax=Corchorus olitorius TaxID=93759 RepID=A0A1R3J9A5_9ROSI|nr:hypothetical protein COLO4_18388 [Corchorus olitorius]